MWDKTTFLRGRMLRLDSLSSRGLLWLLAKVEGGFWENIYSQHATLPASQEWVALYWNHEDPLLEWVVEGDYLEEFSFGLVHTIERFMGSFPNWCVGLQLFTLIEVQPNATTNVLSGWITRVRIDVLTCDVAQTKFKLFVGRLDQLYFDLGRWWWHEVTPFLAYYTKFGRSWITTQIVLKNQIYDKWKNLISPFPSPRWNLIWHKHKAHKEVDFLWFVLQCGWIQQVVGEDLKYDR